MKRLLAILILFIISVTGRSQECCPIINELSVTPANPTSSDTVKIKTVITVHGGSRKVSDNVTIVGNTIKIVRCMSADVASVVVTYFDTVQLAPLTEGTYTIELTAYESWSNFSCEPQDSNSRTQMFQVDNFTSDLQDVKSIRIIKLSPNPASDVQTMLLNNNQYGTVDITLLDLTGRNVKKVHKGLLPKGENLIAVDIADLPSGVYFYRILFGKEVEFVKVVKQ